MMDFQSVQQRNLSAADRLDSVVRECERDGRLDWLERYLLTLTAQVSRKAEAHRHAEELERKGREGQLSTVRGWLSARLQQLEAEARAKCGRSVRTRRRVSLWLDDAAACPDASFGVTLSRRTGDVCVYYVANIPEPRGYRPHPVEAWLFPRASYCGPEIDAACDRLARRLLGHALNRGVSFEALYLMVHGTAYS